MKVIDAHSGLERLSRDECVRLLGAHEVGRLVVTDGGRPLIFPVNYAMDGDAVVFRTASGLKLWTASRSPVVFEVDDIDRRAESGWSVIVHGVAQEVTAFDRADLQARVYSMPLQPWAPGDKPSVVRIVPTLITGRRIRHHPNEAPDA
jgi:nitroimidazol reductase NimA-like FMN-containing flavoprotein (pyridoxamine 5'-phosphate oxidase superfamily)